MPPAVLILVAIQGASPAPPAAGPPPDVAIEASARIRSVDIRSQGTARAEVTAEPGDREIVVERSQPSGGASYRNLEIDVRIAAFLTDPALVAQDQMNPTEPTGEPQE